VLYDSTIFLVGYRLLGKGAMLAPVASPGLEGRLTHFKGNIDVFPYHRFQEWEIARLERHKYLVRTLSGSSTVPQGAVHQQGADEAIRIAIVQTVKPQVVHPKSCHNMSIFGGGIKR